jgi:hypothetical protein
MKLLLPTSLLLLFATACKKDSGEKSALDGNWNFTSLSATTSSTEVVDDGGGVIEKTVTTSSYTSTNNKGTVAIGGGVMTAKGLSYAVDVDASYTYYINDVEQESGTEPFSYTIPPTNSVASFKLVGADSIYFASGGFGGTSGASGGKYSLSGNTLTMIMKLDTSFVDNSSGFPIQKHDVATETTLLTRQ